MSISGDTGQWLQTIRRATSVSASHVSELPSALRMRAVVLAGGSGTQLWPVSSKHFPKQLVDVLGMDSLLHTTVRRLEGFNGEGAWVHGPPIIVCGAEHYLTTSRRLEELGVGARFIIEPDGHNTAPALSLAAMLAAADDGDSLLVVMPAGHTIGDVEAFRRTVAIAYARHLPRIRELKATLRCARDVDVELASRHTTFITESS